MDLRSLLVATDQSADGRHVVGTACRLASRANASLTVLEVVIVGGDGPIPMGRVVTSRDGREPTPELAHFERWLGAPRTDDSAKTGRASARPYGAEMAVAYGIPGIEIGRMADDRGADLIVLGRRPRSADHPLLLGETADAVVRRSPRPVLLVPSSVTALRRVLVALDGTDRTLVLVEPALALAKVVGADVSAVTVRNTYGSGMAPDVDRLTAALARMTSPARAPTVKVRSGNPIAEVLAEVEEAQPDVLVIGYRRGGPPKVVGPMDIARNLLFSAPSAVMTVPL